MEYRLSGSALKDLKKLPVLVRKRIINKLDFFVSTDNPVHFAEAIIDDSLGSYRFRIGDYRAIFDVSGNKIVVLVIGHRKDVYK